MRFSIRRCEVIRKWWVYDNSKAQRTVAFKTKKEALAQALVWNKEEDTRPKVVYAGLNDSLYKLGIHIFEPDARAFENALGDAEKHGFETIYVHTSKVISILRGAA